MRIVCGRQRRIDVLRPEQVEAVRVGVSHESVIFAGRRRSSATADRIT